MTRLLLLLLFVMGLVSSPAAAADKDSRVYELRTYYAAPGKLDALHARFRDHTMKLFEKHGFTNVGYWVPVDNPDHKLIYVVSFPSAEAREKAWKDFLADPVWQKVYNESHEKAGGKIVQKVESLLMQATDYSPAVKATKEGPRVFELRTYTAEKDRLDDLNARFRDHTVALFKKHGMTNVAYWTLLEGQEGADTTLVYILGHKSVDHARASFDAFRKDPEWVKARQASEEKAGGSLTVQGGVKSLFMKPTDYSPLQ